MAKAPAHYYECKGSVNGTCDHYHRTLSGAVDCLRRRQRGCHQQGGYCDAEIYEVTDGEPRLVRDSEYDDDAAFAEEQYQQQVEQDEYDDREAR